MEGSPAVAAARDHWGRDPAAAISGGVLDWAYRSWFRVAWEGLEHVPRSGGALLVSNHAGMVPVDGGLIQIGIERHVGRRVYGLAHHGFFRWPFVGDFLRHAGAICANPDNAHRLLRDEGQLVLVFPEGAKGPVKPARERYRLQRFGRAGFVETAVRAGVPIVPIALMGTDDTTPTLAVVEIAGQRVPITLNALVFGPLLGSVAHLPVKIRARVLAPVHFDERPEQPSYPRSVLMDRAEAIRCDLQAALDEMHAARRSKWFG